jgi:hypothetical protein
MVSRLLRKAYRLADEAAPVLAERARRRPQLAKLIREYARKRTAEKAPLAQQHLLRVIAVWRYGNPKINEPLKDAYERALSKHRSESRLEKYETLAPGSIEREMLRLVTERLKNEHPDGNIDKRFSALIQEMPYWLYVLCDVARSVAELQLPERPQVEFHFAVTNADKDAWPALPQGVLEPRAPQEQFDLNGKPNMTIEEALEIIRITAKPENRWLRSERKFFREVTRRMAPRVLNVSSTNTDEEEELPTAGGN